MSEQAESRGFEPARHLSKISGADYLEVKWRLVWFRERYPDGSIETELVRYDEREAVVKATVTAREADGTIRGSGSGYGSEKPGDFRDFLEKAETKAIGRALATMGFGTQFTPDFDGGAQGRPVDAPVRRGPSTDQQAPWEQGQATNRPASGNGQRSGGSDRPATDSQRTFIGRLLRTVGMDMDAAASWCVANGFTSETMTSAQASQFIDHLKGLETPGGDQ